MDEWASYQIYLTQVIFQFLFAASFIYVSSTNCYKTLKTLKPYHNFTNMVHTDFLQQTAIQKGILKHNQLCHKYAIFYLSQYCKTYNVGWEQKV